MMGIAGFLIPIVSIAARGDAPAGAALALRPPRRRAQADPARRAARPRPGVLGAARAGDHGAAGRLPGLGGTVLVAAALPAFALQLTPGSTFGIPRTPQAVHGFDVLQGAVGPGAVAPSIVLVTASEGDGARAEVEAAVGALSRRSSARTPRSRPSPRRRPAATSTRRGTYRQVLIAGAHDYGFPEAQAFVHRLRDELIPAAAFPQGVEVIAGGAPPQGVDFLHRAYSYFPPLIAAVLLLTYVLLVRAFRSLLLPLKAVLLNLLSIGAAYGMLVVVFSWGVGEDAARALPVRPGRGLDPDLPVRDALRPLDGLRGVPRHAHARGVGRGRRQRDRGRPRARAHRPDHHRGGDHHVRRVLRVRRRDGSSGCSSSGSGSRSRSSSTRRSSARILVPSMMAALRPLELVAAGVGRADRARRAVAARDALAPDPAPGRRCRSRCSIGPRMKGLICAGGTATRLEELTRVTNKHLLPVGALADGLLPAAAAPAGRRARGAARDREAARGRLHRPARRRPRCGRAPATSRCSTST